MQKSLINLGSGSRSAFRYLETGQSPEGWREIRIDLDPDSNPDIVASLTDLRAHVEDNSADVVFSSHAIEHVADHEVEDVFAEIIRVLKPGGFLILSTPDLGQVIKGIDPEDLEKPLYHSPAGPISALDVLYGHRASIADGQHYMRHRTGFTEKSMADRLLASGFQDVWIHSGASCDMIVLAGFGNTPDMGITEKIYPQINFHLDHFEQLDRRTTV